MTGQELTIRTETTADHPQVEQLVATAFKAEAYSDNNEHHLVARLRNSEFFIPELSLVACLGDQIVGHVLVTRITMIDANHLHSGLSLAPISVHPVHQGKGIGTKLMHAAHNTAQQLGFNWIVLIGHEDYYPKFGYEEARKYGISFSIEAPSENCLVKALKPGVLDQIQGQVKYPKIYFE